MRKYIPWCRGGKDRTMTKTEAEQLVQSLSLDEKLRLDELLSSIMQARHPQPTATEEKSELRS